MKSILLYIITLLFAVTSVFANDEYHNNKIIIKFKGNSEAYYNWLNSNRKNYIKDFENLLGKHSIKPYVRDEVLKAFEKRISRNNLNYSAIDEIENLRRIAYIDYEKDINPIYAARKLSSYDFIEYAEPYPIHKLVTVPNDALVFEQYYLDTIKVFDAWNYADTSQIINVGIIDTGIDYDHEDLAENIFNNPGEIGLDSLGRDKSSNNIDDDNNGFIDDWRGWDFVSSDSSGQDNDPKPGHIHGTHVGGIIGASINNGIGIAGIANKVRLIPVKIGSDNPFSTSIENGYEAILYAAGVGADIINCSWGSGSKGQAEAEIIKTVVNSGVVIVAAAGNNGSNTPFFPASYDGVMSVAAVDRRDKKAYFSNYDKSVDISAPGVAILSSVPKNDYNYLDGTSFASPITAGVATLLRAKKKGYTNIQLIEHLKVTSTNIDTLNLNYVGKIGKGRVNALNALSKDNAKSVILTNYIIEDENKDGVFDPGEKVDITATFQNILDSLTGVKVLANSDAPFNLTFSKADFFIGDMSVGLEATTPTPFSFRLPDLLPIDYQLDIALTIRDSKEIINREILSLTVNPSFRTIRGNDIAVTLNSVGNFAYNDYPKNLQGDGFSYKDSYNLLFEGALMVGINDSTVSDVARGYDQSSKNNAFITTNVLKVNTPGIIANTEAETDFKDNSLDYHCGVSVSQKVYQFNDDKNRNYILSIYDITNISEKAFDSLYFGFYFDWDIGPSGSNNQADFDRQYQFGYVKNVNDSSLPMTGVKLLSPYPVNYFALDNDGNTEDNPGVYDGFTIQEKWKTLSSGLKRTKSNVTDVSQIISAGPIKLFVGDTVRLAFSIFASYNYDDLITASQESFKTANKHNLIKGNYNPLPPTDEISIIYPNPLTAGELTVSYTLLENTNVTMSVYDILGRKCFDVLNDEPKSTGRHKTKILSTKLPGGVYYLLFKTSKKKQVIGFVNY
ncbi:MAG: S8 family serine peptidase [Candidatus Kapabacteria bacterium]|nr:S8 family serine peptidase [Candidatus Kapabacteria bacterium]